MENKIEEIVKDQDLKKLKELSDEGFNFDKIKLVEVLKIIFDASVTQVEKKEKENILSALNTDFIMYFIDNGADINATTYTDSKYGVMTSSRDDVVHYGRIPLSCYQFAFCFYDKELIKYFTENGADINQEFYLTHATKNNFYQSYPLLSPYNRSDYPGIKYFLDKGAKINENIHYIVPRKYEATKLLLESGTFVSLFRASYDESALEYFAGELFSLPVDQFSLGKDKTESIIKYIELFIGYGADVNQGCAINKLLDSKAICYDKKLDLLNLFLENGLDVNCKDSDANTPLHKIASYNGKTLSDSFSFLRERKTREKHYTIKEKIARIMIKEGANINAKNNMHMTPLMYASLNGYTDLVELLLDNGADINARTEATASTFASDDKIRKIIDERRNNRPQKLVKILTNFTKDTPIKYTTHLWDFGDLDTEYGGFEGFMEKIKTQWSGIEGELKELSSNLHRKIYDFLLNDSIEQSWSSKSDIKIGWSSLDGLAEWCDKGNKPSDFKLPKPISLDRRTVLGTFGDVIDQFKQEIEIRRDFKSLSKVFEGIKKHLGEDYNISTTKLDRQFYADTEKLSLALDSIFEGIKKHKAYKDIEVIANDPDDSVVELKIIHTNSISTQNAEELYLEDKEGGDFSAIRSNLLNLCDWSVEGSFQDENFRINYLKSNNIEDIVPLKYKPKGFTYILRFFKR